MSNTDLDLGGIYGYLKFPEPRGKRPPPVAFSIVKEKVTKSLQRDRYLNDQFHHIFTQTAPFLVDKPSGHEEVYVIPQVINLPNLEPKEDKKSEEEKEEVVLDPKKIEMEKALRFRSDIRQQLSSYITESAGQKGYKSVVMLVHSPKVEHYFVLHIHLEDCTIDIYDSLLPKESAFSLNSFYISRLQMADLCSMVSILFGKSRYCMPTYKQDKKESTAQYPGQNPNMPGIYFFTQVFQIF